MSSNIDNQLDATITVY